ncbi:hypothetical protein B0J13DRAFT_531240 [Dactylonectria estremocensis]|uniref:NACHT-NTPase and P-loop NTPases N-terminal domain-containing protein n=1 Tax=Dactylonectria estremocensis TaxID=1079267 RepID=A0A9P9DTG0_9HYPO|nr:hypothetical protein B0J13DRAFT_531240 [Dactylonectria estremocensis]
MDPLSVITSTITVVQAISSTYKAIQHLRGLPNEFNEVGRNLPLAQDILGLARDQLRGLALDESSKKALQPLVSGCEEKAKMLQDIFEKVEKKVKNAEDGSILTFYRSSLLHLGKAHRVETLMQGILRGLDALATNQLFKTATQSQMAQLKGAIVQLSNVESSILDSDFEGSVTQNIASEGTAHQPVVSGQDRNINSGSGKQCNAHTMTFVQSKEDYKTRGDILQSLHTSPYLDRKNRNPDRVPGTCKWFIDHDHFQQWRERKSSSMLWVSANPGCGKSILAKYLVDSELKTTISRTTSYFFFKDDFEDQRSATSALSCILHQLFTQREIIFSNKIVKRFKAYKAHLTSSFDELWDILVMASQDKNAAELVCILDAFDECKHQERNKLAQALRNFYSTDNDTKNNVNLKFLITSRPYDEISRHFQPLNIPGLSVIHLKGESDAEMSKITQEIDVYIRDRVSLVRANRDLTPEEEQLLLQRLRRVPNQTYMWAYLVLQLIEKDLSIDKTTIREVTSSLPRTVDDVYERILPKNNPRDAEEAERAEKVKKMLHVIVAAARPLTLAEMDLALALQKEHTSYEGWHRKPEERFSSFIRDLCGLFITITDSKICLIHQTAKEFLVAKDNLDPRTGHDNPLKWKYSLQPPVSHRVLCQICIWHLLFTEFETNPLEEYSDDEVSHYLRGHVFLDYSATNWAAHFRASGIENDAVIESVWRICDATSRRCGTWFRVYWANTDTGFPQGFTTLMIASYFGLEQIRWHLSAFGTLLGFREWI